MNDYIYGSLILIGLLNKYLNLDFRRQDREKGYEYFFAKIPDSHIYQVSQNFRERNVFLNRGGVPRNAL